MSPILIHLFFRLIKKVRNPLRYRYFIRALMKVFDLCTRLPKGVIFAHGKLGITCVEQIVPTSGKKLQSVFLYIHGGAFVLQLNNLYRKFSATIAQATGLKVILVDYGLAPENPYPTALEECFVVYQSLLQQGLNSKQIIVGGDSAGGNLALALLLKIKETQLPLPSAIVTISPWVDLCLTGSSLQTRKKQDPLINPDHMPYIVHAYLQNSISCEEPYISPLYGDLKGLPPLFIIIGENEVLWDDALRLAEKARASGISIEILIGSNMPHVYPILFPKIQESLIAYNHLIKYLLKHSS